MAEFEVSGFTYKNTKFKLMDAVDLMIDLGPLIVAKETEGGASIAAALSNMPRDKIHMVVSVCLGSCERKMPGGKGWAKIWNEPSQQPMFDDIGLMETGSIIWAVLKDNYGSFLPGKG